MTKKAPWKGDPNTAEFTSCQTTFYRLRPLIAVNRARDLWLQKILIIKGA